MFAATLSNVAAETLAAFVTWPAVGGYAVTVTVALPAFAITPKSQLTTAPIWLNEPWLLCADTKIRFAGKVSVTTTPEALLGPRLVTVMVKTRLLVATTVEGETIMLAARFASGEMVLTTVSELLVDCGSVAEVLSVAELVARPSIGGRAVTVASLVEPLGMLPKVMVTTPWYCVAAPFGLADTKAKLDGNVSTTCTPLAEVGPALVAVMM